MNGPYWTLIFVLALVTFSIRVAGLLVGDRMKASRHAWILDDLPGLIVVSLVATSLAGQPVETWVAAMIALGIAIATNHVIATMCAGVAIYAAFNLI